MSRYLNLASKRNALKSKPYLGANYKGEKKGLTIIEKMTNYIEKKVANSVSQIPEIEYEVSKSEVVNSKSQVHKKVLLEQYYQIVAFMKKSSTKKCGYALFEDVNIYEDVIYEFRKKGIDVIEYKTDFGKSVYKLSFITNRCSQYDKLNYISYEKNGKGSYVVINQNEKKLLNIPLNTQVDFELAFTKDAKEYIEVISKLQKKLIIENIENFDNKVKGYFIIEQIELLESSIKVALQEGMDVYVRVVEYEQKQYNFVFPKTPTKKLGKFHD